MKNRIKHLPNGDFEVEYVSVSDIASLLITLREYFDNKADAEYVGDPPVITGNKEMMLAYEIDEMIKKLQNQ